MAYSASVVVTSGGTPTTLPYGDSVSITRKLSDTLDWQYSVKDDLRELHPEKPTGSYTGLLDDNAYDTDGLTVNKTVAFSGTYSGGSSWALPSGIPDSYTYQLRAGDNDEQFSWKGKGLAAVLYRPHLSLSTVVSTKTAATGAAAWSSGTTYAEGDFASSGGVTYESLAGSNTNHTPASSPSWWSVVSTGTLYYVQDVLATIFAAYGLTYDVSAVSPNYLIPRFHMQDGSPIDWVRQLLEVTQAEWYEGSDGKIYCIQPDWSGSSYDYTFSTDSVKIREISGGQSAVVDFANYVICQRADDTGGVVAQVDKKDASFGRQGTITLSQPVPVTSLHWVKKTELIGQTSDFYVYGPDGPPAAPIDARELKGAAPTLQSGSTAYSVEFTFGAFTGSPFGATSGSYSLEFRADNTYGVYEDETTSLVVQNTTSIESGRGKVQMRLGPNPLIADSTTLQTWGERVLYKSSRKRVELQVTLFLPDSDTTRYSIRPGHRVRIEDAQFGTTRVYTVMQVTHQLTAAEHDRLTQLTLVAYV